MFPRFGSLLKLLSIAVVMLTLRATVTLLTLEEPDIREDPATFLDIIKAMKDTEPKIQTYKEALTNAATNKVVLIALVDWGFMDMTMNFYESSLYPYGIDNYLFLASDPQSCLLLSKLAISCHVYVKDESGAQASEYQSKAFIRKMNYRTEMIIEALSLGFTVLHSDIDIMFLQNPFDHINCTEHNGCDVRSLWDSTKYNAGFIYLRPTKGAISLYKNMRSISKKQPKMDDQIQMVHALESMRRRNVSIDIERLDEEKFQCGRCYFEDMRRVYAGDNPCKECVVVHNNWIVTKEAKRYRAREHHHWYHDWGGYYSKDSTKYIIYDNPLSDCTTYWDAKETKARELSALKNALAYGQILNRIVILPQFHCEDTICALNSHIKIQAFDKAFDNQYREHTFLDHFKVPKHIKDGKSELFFIPGEHVENWCVRSLGDLVKVPSKKPLSDSQIRSAFGDNQSPVLRFYAMHDTFAGFVSKQEAKCFAKLVEQAFVSTDYRQQKPPPKP